MSIVTHILCFVGGSVCGVFFLALFVAAGREDARTEAMLNRRMEGTS